MSGPTTKRALVTGATGFLGRVTALRLRDAGYEVTATGRNKRIGEELAALGLRFLPLDIRDANEVARAVEGHDYVFHSAALSTPWGRPQDFHDINVLGTRHVAEAALATEAKRMVHVSSPSIYVDHRDRLLVREDEPLPTTPINDYARTKRDAEVEIARSHARGLNVVTIRPQAIFGPGDQAIFPRLVRVARKGFIPVVGSGNNVVDVSYVDNVADAMIAAGEADDAHAGKAYNITNGEPVPFYDVLDRVLTALHIPYKRKRLPFRVAYAAAGALESGHRRFVPSKEPILTRYSVCVLGLSRTLDITAAKRDLGYAPTVSVDEGIERFVAWYREHGRD